MRRALLVAAALMLTVSAAASAQRPGPEAQAPLRFWQALGDTTLQRLAQQALDANRDLRAAAARTGAARAARTDAALDLAPAVTASLGFSRQRLSSASVPGAADRLPDQNLWDGGMQLSWELDVFGRGRRTLQGRNALLTSAEADVADLQVEVITHVARVYFDLRGTQDRLDVARRNAENQRRSLDLTLARLDAGTGTALDSERAQAQLSSTLAVIPSLESAIAADVHRLAVLLGRPTAGLLEELEHRAEPMVLPAELPFAGTEDLIRRRPDVRAAESRLAASRAFHGAAKAGYLPRLSITGVAGYTASQFDALGNTGTPRYVVGPVISWPFLDLGRVRTRADAARAAEAEAAAVYEQAVLSAHAEAETSLLSYRNARERLRHLADAAAASERATELARLRFEEGGTDFLEVLDAERRQLEAQDRLSAGRTEAVSWLLTSYRAIGGGLAGQR